MKFTMKQLITHSIMSLLMLVSVIAQTACQKQPVSMLGADADANGTAPQAKPLPRALLIGDSICGGYCKGVRAKLAGKAVLVKPTDNGRDTWRGLEKLDEWLGDGKWDVVHFNWGLWDVAYRPGGTRGPGGSLET